MLHSIFNFLFNASYSSVMMFLGYSKYLQHNNFPLSVSTPIISDQNTDLGINSLMHNNRMTAESGCGNKIKHQTDLYLEDAFK